MSLRMTRSSSVHLRTVCATPWSVMTIKADGTVTACCHIGDPVTVDGAPASIATHSLSELWNGDQIVAMRRGMARGERLPECARCYEQERASACSPRTVQNDHYVIGGVHRSLDELVMSGSARDQRLDHLAEGYLVEVGNLCNLKCRSCTAAASSRIASDPVHRLWTLGVPVPLGSSGRSEIAGQRGQREGATGGLRMGNVAHLEKLLGAIALEPERVRYVSLVGGEPFLMDDVWRFIEKLVERDLAKHIALVCVTNGTRRRPELERLAPAFRGVHVVMSIDGVGPLYEYLRHGAVWSEVVGNLHWLKGLPNTMVRAIATMQNYNALGALPLFRFCDREELDLLYNLLTSPPRLRLCNLPPLVRRIAAERLRAMSRASAGKTIERSCGATRRRSRMPTTASMKPCSRSFCSSLGSSMRRAIKSSAKPIRSSGLFCARHPRRESSWVCLRPPHGAIRQAAQMNGPCR